MIRKLSNNDVAGSGVAADHAAALLSKFNSLVNGASKLDADVVLVNDDPYGPHDFLVVFGFTGDAAKFLGAAVYERALVAGGGPGFVGADVTIGVVDVATSTFVGVSKTATLAADDKVGVIEFDDTAEKTTAITDEAFAALAGGGGSLPSHYWAAVVTVPASKTFAARIVGAVELATR